MLLFSSGLNFFKKEEICLISSLKFSQICILVPKGAEPAYFTKLELKTQKSLNDNKKPSKCALVHFDLIFKVSFKKDFRLSNTRKNFSIFTPFCQIHIL